MNKNQWNKGNAAYATKVGNINTYSNLAAVAARLGIPVGVLAALLALLTPFNTFWAISKDRKNSTDVDKSNTRLARKALTTYLQNFVTLYYYENKKATATDITGASLIPHIIPQGAYGKPTMIPFMKFAIAIAYTIKGTYRQDDEKTRAKPAGVKFVRVRYFIGANPPTDPAKWASFVDFTKTPFEIVFDSSFEGQPIVLAACFVGNDGQEGKYSVIRTMTVPTAG